MLTAEARQRESSLTYSLIADSAMLVCYAVVSVGAASLPMLAETLRGGTLIALGWMVLWMMRRVHRHSLHGYDYGTGKLERFANLAMGGLLLAGAAWVAVRTAQAWIAGPGPAGSGPWLMAAQLLAGLNVLVNLGAFLALWRASRDGTSLLMAGQVQARAGKVVVSLLVLASVAVSANWPGTRIAWTANLAGGLLVALVMAWIAVSMLRQALPDLLDRALEENLQSAINRSLGAHFHGYETLERVRSRQAGGHAQIEIALGFDPRRNFGEVASLAKAMRQEIEGLIPGAEVMVVPVATTSG